MTRTVAIRYDDEAAAYRDLWAPVLREAGLRLLSALADHRPRRILDIGAGTGTLLADLEERFPRARVVALDRSPGMLRLASSRFPRVVTDAGRLPVAADCADLALLVFMLFHLPAPREALTGVLRALCPGGRTGLATWGRELDCAAMRAWNRCLDDHGAAQPDPALETRHEPFDAPHKLATMLRDAGFRDVRAWDEELVRSIGIEHLLLLRTRMGSSRERLRSLEADSRSRCVAEARRRLTALQPADFVARGRIVCAVGSA